MSGHLSSESIQLALQGELPPDQESAFHEHMESCPNCAAAMEQISGAEQIGREISQLLQVDEIGDVVPGRDEYSVTDFVVEHLEPSVSSESLGQLGGYDILEVIGRGGMGVVLKGYDRELKRFVAIKALAPHLAHSALARKRFAREAQAAAAVVNPHVIAIHQVQPSGRLPFLVMPLLTGESLSQRLKAKGILELKEVLRIGMQAAEGLAAAHEQGLVHRDVKPANILLEKGVERAVLTDFGLARTADDVSLTRMGVIAGTPEYMSPEQAKGEAVDARSDLFSLGCVLYEIATGVSPFRTETPMATLRRIVDEAPRAMSSLNPELPAWFVSVVNRLLAKTPDKRFASARIVSDLLAKCLSHVHQPTTEALPKELEMNTATAPRLCWHEMTEEGPRLLWRRAAVLFGSLTLAYVVTAAVLAVGFGVPIRWSTTGWCFWFVCIGLVTSVESERQRAIHGRWRFRFGLNAVLMIVALLGVGTTLMVQDVSSTLAALQKSAGQNQTYLNPDGGHVEGPDGSSLYIRNDERVQYAFYATGPFTSKSDTSGNQEHGSISLKNKETFDFQRESKVTHVLQVNGNDYDLREGRLFVLYDDGSIIQHGLFPTLQEAQSLTELKKLVGHSVANFEAPKTLRDLRRDLDLVNRHEQALLEYFKETHPLVLKDRERQRQLKDRIQKLVAAGQPAEAPREKVADESKKPFVVHGRVTDESGKPLEGVEVYASCGMGSLQVTGQVKTDTDGRYRLPFGAGPGDLATITPVKLSWYETNLHRQGNLMTAESDAKLTDEYAKKYAGVAIKNKPYELNFVMARGATVSGYLLNEFGFPIAGQSISIGGDELPPSCGVLATKTTHADGRFEFTGVPVRMLGKNAKLKWKFSLRPLGIRHELFTEAFEVEPDTDGKRPAVTHELSLNSLGDDKKGVGLRLDHKVVAQANALKATMAVTHTAPDAKPRTDFTLEEARDLIVNFSLQNTSDRELTIDRGTMALEVNGKPVPGFGDELRKRPDWNSIQSGKTITASLAMVNHFTKPGEYKLQWRGDNFVSDTVTVQITEKTAWGPAVGEWQASIRLAKDQERVISGVALTYEIIVRNITKNEQTISLEPQWFSGRVKEGIIELSPGGIAGDHQEGDKTVPAGEECVVGKAFIGLPGSKINAGHLIEVLAGKYRVVSRQVFLPRGESVNDPSKNVGKPQLATGTLWIEISKPETSPAGNQGKPNPAPANHEVSESLRFLHLELERVKLEESELLKIHPESHPSVKQSLDQQRQLQERIQATIEREKAAGKHAAAVPKTFDEFSAVVTPSGLGRELPATITISPDGKCVYEVAGRPARNTIPGWPSAKVTHTLLPARLAMLTELLKARNWFDKNEHDGKVSPPRLHSTAYTVKLKRGGETTSVTFHHEQEPYKPLATFLNALSQQEFLLYQLEIVPGRDYSASARHTLDSYLRAELGQPFASKPTFPLDYARFTEWATGLVRKPNGKSDDDLLAAVRVVAHLRLDSERKHLTELKTHENRDVRRAAGDALAWMSPEAVALANKLAEFRVKMPPAEDNGEQNGKVVTGTDHTQTHLAGVAKRLKASTRGEALVLFAHLHNEQNANLRFVAAFALNGIYNKFKELPHGAITELESLEHRKVIGLFQAALDAGGN